MMSEYYFIRGNLNSNSSGFIPDVFVEKALGHYERRGTPFLENQKNAKHDIYLDNSDVLHLGRPLDHYPEPPSWREYYTEYQGYTEDELLSGLEKITNGLSVDELDEPVYDEFFYDNLAHNYLPAARFVHLVDKLKLGTDDPKCGHVLGSLKRYEGSFTGSDVLCMTLLKPITISWVQWAMNQAGESCNVYNLKTF
jgi:hypothetical protein